MPQTQRRAANEWFDHTLYSRLNDKIEGSIALIMHCLLEYDLVGHVQGISRLDVLLRVQSGRLLRFRTSSTVCPKLRFAGLITFQPRST